MSLYRLSAVLSISVSIVGYKPMLNVLTKSIIASDISDMSALSGLTSLEIGRYSKGFVCWHHPIRGFSVTVRIPP